MTVPVHGLPPVLSVGMRVAVVPPALRSDRWHEVLSVSTAGGEGQLVCLSGSDGIGSAEELVGKTLLVDACCLPEDAAMRDVDALLGREVVDVNLGPLGAISEVLRGPAQDVWVISGPYGEVMLPAVDEVVLGVSDDAPIEVRAPEGSVSREDL